MQLQVASVQFLTKFLLVINLITFGVFNDTSSNLRKVSEQCKLLRPQQSSWQIFHWMLYQKFKHLLTFFFETQITEARAPTCFAEKLKPVLMKSHQERRRWSQVWNYVLCWAELHERRCAVWSNCTIIVTLLALSSLSIFEIMQLKSILGSSIFLCIFEVALEDAKGDSILEQPCFCNCQNLCSNECFFSSFCPEPQNPQCLQVLPGKVATSKACKIQISIFLLHSLGRRDADSHI